MTDSFPRLASPFYFVRHGVTDHNQVHLVMGQRDIPLNGEGQRQARRAAHVLEGRGIRTVVSSPLARARETAEIIAVVLGVPVIPEPAFMERAWGIYEGRNRILRPLYNDPAGGETWQQFADRTLAGLNRMNAATVIVAHNGTCRVLRYHLRVPGADDTVPNASPLYYEHKDHEWREQTIIMMATKPAFGPGHPT